MILDHFSLSGPIFAALLSALLLPSSGAPSTSPLLLVVNQGDATVSIVDPRAARQLATIPEQIPGSVGHEVATSPDGRLAYVPLYGNTGVGKPGNDGRLMLVIDLATRSIVHQLDFGHGVRPHCAVYDRARDLLYVTTELDQAIAVIDPHTLRIVGTIPTGQPQSHMFALSHDGSRGYTANVGPGTVSVLDMARRSLITTIPVSSNTQRIAVSNDDKLVFTADQTQPRLAVIDTAANHLSRWIALPSPGYGTAPTPDGRFLLVTLPAQDSLAVVDLNTFQVERTIKIGSHPQEVIVTPDGRTAYASNLGASRVSVIDLSSWTVATPIDVGAKADGMAWVSAPAQGTAP